MACPKCNGQWMALERKNQEAGRIKCSVCGYERELWQIHTLKETFDKEIVEPRYIGKVEDILKKQDDELKRISIRLQEADIFEFQLKQSNIKGLEKIQVQKPYGEYKKYLEDLLGKETKNSLLYEVGWEIIQKYMNKYPCCFIPEVTFQMKTNGFTTEVRLECSSCKAYEKTTVSNWELR